MAQAPSSSTSSEQSGAVSETSQNPYYLHHSDTSSLVLVSELLREDNYVTWSRSMKIALAIRNKLGFVDGTLIKPISGDLLPLWIRNNYVVIAWILNSVSKSISTSIIFSESARSIWLDLEQRFQKRNGPRIFHLKRRLATIRQEQETVTAYFSKLKSLWDEYISYRPAYTCGKCICDGVQNMEKFLQFEYLINFLMGLGDRFSHARSQILNMENLPDVTKAFSLIVQEEEHRFADENEAVVLVVPSKSGNHGNKSKSKPTCAHCHIQGHTIDKCYRLHGFPPGYRQRNANKSSGSTSTVPSTPISNTMSNVSTSAAYQASVEGMSVEDSYFQYQNILNMLHNKLNTAKTEAMPSTSGVNLAGKVHFEDDWDG